MRTVSILIVKVLEFNGLWLCSFEIFLFRGVWNIMDTFKTILFCIGLILTLWRSYECLLKHLNENLGTRVFMVPSYETLFPSLTLCPHYHEAYDLGKVFHTLYRYKLYILLFLYNFQFICRIDIYTF